MLFLVEIASCFINYCFFKERYKKKRLVFSVMVRINLISPEKLADQHLIAEYNEILMLVGYVRKYPLLEGIPLKYCLGKGHVRFFKDKLGYLKERHDLLKKEMKKRGFQAGKTVGLRGFGLRYRNSWKPLAEDFDCVKSRIKEKILLKPDFYRYYCRKESPRFFFSLLS